VRLGVGPFGLESAVEVETLRRAFADGTWASFLLPTDSALLRWHAAILGEENAGNARLGRALSLTPADEARGRSLPAGTPCRAYSLDGRLFALLRYGGDAVWQPIKLLDAVESGPPAPIMYRFRPNLGRIS